MMRKSRDFLSACALLPDGVRARRMRDYAGGSHLAESGVRRPDGFFVTRGSIVAAASTIATIGKAPLNAPLVSFTTATKTGPATPAAPHAVRSTP